MEKEMLSRELGTLGPLSVANAGSLVPVTGAFVLVAVGPRGNAVALLAAQPTVL